MLKEKYLFLSFDIPREKASFRVKIWRRLKEIEARQKLGSYWMLSYSKQNLNNLKKIVKQIKKSKGRAEIIVGRLI